MIISIKTKPRNRPSSVSTCVNEAKIYLYVSQKNCTVDEASDNYCQKCIDEYGKSGNNCYHKSEKFTNLYYDKHSQEFKQCEINNLFHNCSICPKGSYILEKNLFQIYAKNVLNGNIQIVLINMNVFHALFIVLNAIQKVIA